MDKKRNCMRKSTGIALAALLVIAAAGIMPAAASVLPDGQTLYVETANTPLFNKQNNGTYFIDWTNFTGGLNALHISDDYSDLPGDIYTTSSASGFFYVTDDGGRNYQDNIVLLVALNKTETSGEVSIKINSSGYSWTPTASGLAPIVGEDDYQDAAIGTNAIFEESDFIYGPQIWKPGPVDNYPIYDGTKYYKLAFIDLYVGTVNNNSLTYNGNVKVEYEITGDDLEGDQVIFNTYAWNNQTLDKKTGLLKYTQGIRWTNNVTGTTESSLWVVNV